MTSHPLEELAYPPFAGFPPEGLAFLRRLKRNNTRPWFQRHKTDYEELVRFPMECLIASLRPRMTEVAPDFDFHPRRSIFRVYRDTRFSHDKTPYKTNIAASFASRILNERKGTAGLYVGVELGEIFVGGGIYMPDSDQLKSIRAWIAAKPGELREVVEHPAFRKVFGEILGDRLVRVPLGYRDDHPMITYLRLKQFYVGVEYEEKECLKPRFLDNVVRVFTAAMPFIRWLQRATLTAAR